MVWVTSLHINMTNIHTSSRVAVEMIFYIRVIWWTITL